MEYPKRSESHQIEAESRKILNILIPQRWIVRELSERDYGIDLYIELTNKGFVTGNMMALQVKGKEMISFNQEGKFRFSGIKKSTIRYWLGLPVPIFFVAVCLASKRCFFVNIKEANRKYDLLDGSEETVSLCLQEKMQISSNSSTLLEYIYYREKRWPDVEKAIERSLMFFNSLGPFCLKCMREKDHRMASTTIQYILIEHYEYFRLFSRFLTNKRPVAPGLPHWYDKHLEMHKDKDMPSTFTFGLIKEMIRFFIWDYYACIKGACKMIIIDQPSYFKKRFPFMYLHLKMRPLAFVEEDWFCRYIKDEYERDTMHIEKKFFEDFKEYDQILDLTKIPH